MPTDFFVQRPSVYPTIYAYALDGVSSHKGYIKVGYTERDVEKRIAEQMHTSGIAYKILLRNLQCVKTVPVLTTMTFMPFYAARAIRS